MPPTEDKLQVRIKRMPTNEPPLKPHQRWALLATGALVLGLVLYCASLLGARPQSKGPTVALTPAPPNALKRPAEVPTAADGTPLIDLVCGAPVDDTAPYRTEFYGKTFYFAHSECLERFRAKPEAYVKVKVKVNVKMNPEDPVPQEEDTPVPEATAGSSEEETIPADDSSSTVTEEPPAADPGQSEATIPPSEPPAASEPPAVGPSGDGPIGTPNPDGSVWKDASGNPIPEDNGSEPSWLPPDPAAAPPPAAPSNNGVPGWVPGGEPTIESQPVP